MRQYVYILFVLINIFRALLISILFICQFID